MNNPQLYIFRWRLVCVLLIVWMAALLSPHPVVAQGGVMANPTPTPTPTPLPPPAPPTVLAPADGSLTTIINAPPLAMPVLIWTQPESANIYHFQISDAPGLSTILIESDTYATTYTPTAVWQDGFYYWRVRAGQKEGSKATVWGEYSDIFSFEKNWSNDPSNRPQLLSPEADALRTSFTAQEFSWTPVMGAAGYKLDISTNGDFSNIVYSAETLKPHHTPTRRLAANDAYYWRVIPFAYHTTPKDRVNGATSPTSVFKFSWSMAPQLLNPPALVNGVKPELRFLPRFTWLAVEGAKEYQIEISTDQSFGSGVTAYTTRSTDFTPIQALSNDQEYFWRVKATNAEGYSTAWSEVRSFRMKWNVAPKLLTPANNQTYISYPYFTWEPVAGAERYRFKMTDGAGENAKIVANEVIYNVNHFAYRGPWANLQHDKDYYWQVQAIDARGNLTPWSETFSFRLSKSVIPNLIYPLPYYAPDQVGHPVNTDRTVAWPLFVWDTAHASEWPVDYAAIPDYYELAVAISDTFAPDSTVYQARTRGLAIAPTTANPWTPQDGQVYFWRVRPFWGGNSLPTEHVWKMRYDRTRSVYTPTNVMTPIYPADGFQAVGDPPVLGWLPFAGATSYRVQISRRPDVFSAPFIVDEAHALSINYVPWQERLTDMPAGSYWWRVQPESAPDVPLGDWSEPRRFDLSNDLITGNYYDLPVVLTEGTTIMADPTINNFTFQAVSAVETGDDHELGKLHIMLARRPDPNSIYNASSVYNLYWVFAFSVAPSVASDVAYDLYVDYDHIPGFGATSDAYGRALTFDDLHRPDFLVHVDRSAAGVSAGSVTLHRWGVGGWLAGQTFDAIGGKAWLCPDPSVVQVLVPYTALGGADDNFSGSLALALLSMKDNVIRDSAPPQGVIYGVANQLDNYAYISDMLLPLYPFDAPLTNPDQFYEMPVLRWRMPYFDSVDGYQVQVARDARFSDILETWETYETNRVPIWGVLPTAFVSQNAINDNETYYWRVRIRHEIYQPPPLPPSFDYGPWSPALRFKLSSRLPGNPALSTGSEVYMTPAFLWERVEGASGYTIQIDNDANFSSPLVSQAVDGTSYTPQETFASAALIPGTQYYWRLAMRRSSSVIGQWTPTMAFQKASVSPTLITPTEQMTVTGQPTFAWNAILTPPETPRLAAPLYNLQVDDDPTFGSPLINIKTAATAYTPTKGQSLTDGIWYWRVALTDANDKNGPFSAPRQFGKQYSLPALLAPQPGGTVGSVPSFGWTPLENAAYYEVTYANNPAFTGATKATTVSSTHTPVKNLATGRYYWYVQMFDQDKKGGPIIARYFDFGYAVYLPLTLK